jgi:hypothetical protein
VIRNLEVGPLYNRTSNTDESVDADYGIFLRDDTDITVENNVLHDVDWAVEAYCEGGETVLCKNMTYSHNEVYRFNIGFDLHGNGGSVGPWTVNNNHFHDTCNWDDEVNNPYHHNPVHVFGGEMHNAGFYYYDNLMDGCFGVTSTSTGIFIEGHGDSPAFDSTSPVYVFNNVLLNSTANPAESVWSMSTGDEHVFNNTSISPGNVAVFGCWQGQATDQPTYCTAENNVSVLTSDGNQWIYRNATVRTIDYNVYQGGGSAVDGAPVKPSNCATSFDFATQFAAYRSCMKAEAHSVYTTNMKLAANGVPQTGSPALSAGTNLTSLCAGALVPLCSDFNGNPRPTSGPWTAGAYQVG